MTVREIIDIIESYAPLSLAFSYDNCGLQIGDYAAEAKKIVVSVDLTREVIEKASGKGANLIITHHPLLFNPIKRIVVGDYVSELIMAAISKGINVYSAHTNADNAERGLNKTLISKLGGYNVTSLSSDGAGALADYGMTLKALTDKISRTVKGVLRIDAVKTDCDSVINKIALITGCGGRDSDLPRTLSDIGADCLITAETAHHIRRELIERKINLIEFGHYESERIFIDIVSEWLREAGVEIIKAYDSAFEN